MKEKYFTITGFSHYYGKKPFRLGGLVLCRKEPDNPVDAEAIRCSLPRLGAVGYVANSPGTVAGGSMSAGRLYDHVDSFFYARVLFTTASKVICRVEDAEPRELEEELKREFSFEDDDGDECPRHPFPCLVDRCPAQKRPAVCAGL